MRRVCLLTSSLSFQRYDARLLLDALPSVSSSGNRIHANAATTRPSSPGGWSDLPSDAEETFGLSRLEMEDFHREKRRKTMYRVREERLKARMEEEGEEGEEEGPREGDSDEEVCSRPLSQKIKTNILNSSFLLRIPLRPS